MDGQPSYSVQIKVLSMCEKNYSVLIRVPFLFQYRFWFMVFNATFNNISVISWGSILLMEETGIPRENHRPVTSH